LTDAGTTPDDASSLPVRARLHTDSEPLRSHVPELFGKAAEHCGSCKLELCSPSRVVDQNDELVVANELWTHLTRDFGADDLLPTTGDTAENESVFHAAFVQQPVDGLADGYRQAIVWPFLDETSRVVAVFHLGRARPTTVHYSSLPSTRRATRLGVAPGGSPPAVVKRA